MNRMLRSLTLALFVALVSPAFAAALDFRVLGWNAPVENLYYVSRGKDVAITAGVSGLSPVFNLDNNTGTLRLYRLNAENKRVPAADITTPPGLTRGILLLHAESGGAYSGKWIDDSPGITPAGAMRILNFASKPVALSIADDAVRTLNPGAETFTRFPANVRAVPVRLASLTDKGWETAMSISQPVRPRLRFVVIVRDARPSLDRPDAIVEWTVFQEAPPAPPNQPGSPIASR